jgi:hypothetical protein
MNKNIAFDGSNAIEVTLSDGGIKFAIFTYLNHVMHHSNK